MPRLLVALLYLGHNFLGQLLGWLRFFCASLADRLVQYRRLIILRQSLPWQPPPKLQRHKQPSFCLQHWEFGGKVIPLGRISPHVEQNPLGQTAVRGNATPLRRARGLTVSKLKNRQCTHPTRQKRKFKHLIKAYSIQLKQKYINKHQQGFQIDGTYKNIVYIKYIYLYKLRHIYTTTITLTTIILNITHDYYYAFQCKEAIKYRITNYIFL